MLDQPGAVRGSAHGHRAIGQFIRSARWRLCGLPAAGASWDCSACAACPSARRLRTGLAGGAGSGGEGGGGIRLAARRSSPKGAPPSHSMGGAGSTISSSRCVASRRLAESAPGVQRLWWPSSELVGDRSPRRTLGFVSKAEGSGAAAPSVSLLIRKSTARVYVYPDARAPAKCCSPGAPYAKLQPET